MARKAIISKEGYPASGTIRKERLRAACFRQTEARFSAPNVVVPEGKRTT
jgi:hypothetical protein